MHKHESNQQKFIGFGLGLRSKHIPHILKNETNVDWFEAISENYFELNADPRCGTPSIIVKRRTPANSWKMISTKAARFFLLRGAFLSFTVKNVFNEQIRVLSTERS